ncbi:MAG: aldo/keto reductase [Ahrensia sp.]
MKRRKLGRSDLMVPELCLGTMTFGTQNTEAEGHQQMDYAVAEGVNFFDTAEMYPATPPSGETMGRTEDIIGTWISKRGKRDDVIIATKVSGENGMHPVKGLPLSAEKVRRSCEESLTRLQTDYVDLYQIHWPNRGSYHFRQMWGFQPELQDTAREIDDITDTLSGLAKLVEEGKIRHVGLSNETAWGTMQWLTIAETNGFPRMISMQNEYSLLHRIYDTDMAELSHHEEIGLLSYSSLACGLLTGKYQDGQMPEGSRRTINNALGGRVTPRVEAPLNAYLTIAQKHGLDPTQMALSWCLTKPFMASIIIGATKMDQLKTCIDAARLELSDAVLAEIEEVYRDYPVPM